MKSTSTGSDRRKASPPATGQPPSGSPPAMEPERRAVSLADLRPHPRNYNRHPAKQVERIAASLRTFGQVRGIVVWRGTILAGHGVVEAARRLGWESLRADVLPDDYPEHLALAYVAADNELGRLADPDMEQLAAILEESRQADAALLEAIGYDDAEFKALLAEVGQATAEPGRDTEPQVDRAEELRQKWGVEPGQLWALGDHRLVCGDCTDPAVVARVMGGEKAQALVTDPPYAILGGGTSTAGKGIEAAFDRQFFRAWFVALLAVLDDHLTHDAAQWMTIDWRGATAIEEALVNKRWRLAALGVWNRGGLGMGYALRKTYENFALLVAKDWKRIKTDEPDVWSFQWTPGNRLQGHAAEKPAELMQRAIEVCSADGIVFDPFLGSGTTLIACENLGRRCRAVEIAPGYVAVALQRFFDHSGKLPELIPAEAAPHG